VPSHSDRKLFLVGISVAAILLFSINASGQSSSVPDWVKNNAKWWSEGNIGESDYLSALEYLINQGIIKVQVPIKKVVATDTNIADSDRAHSFVVRVLSGPDKGTYFTFHTFAHIGLTVTEQSGTPGAQYFGGPQFRLESLPSKDKKTLYNIVNSFIKDIQTSSFEVAIDVVTGDGTIIQTWDYRKCVVSDYSIYVDKSKDTYRFAKQDAMEIREWFDFICQGYSLIIP